MIADIHTGIQTADVIAGLITTTDRIVEYCKKLPHAHDIAHQALDGVCRFDAFLKGVKPILEQRGRLGMPGLSTDENFLFGTSIRESAERCKETVVRIKEHLEIVYNKREDGHIMLTSLGDRQKLVHSTPDIESLLLSLDAHKYDLSLSLLLEIVHQNPQRVVDSLQQSLAYPNSVNILANGNAFTERSISPPDPSRLVRVPSSPRDDDVSNGSSTAGPTLINPSPIHRLTQAVLSRLARDANRRQKYTLSFERPGDDYVLASSPNRSPFVLEEASTSLGDDYSAGSVASRNSVSQYSKNGTQLLRTGRYPETKVNLPKAPKCNKHLGQTESLAASELIERSEDLIEVCAKFRQWDSAVGTLRGALPAAYSLTRQSNETHPGQQKSQKAHCSLLLGYIYLHKYLDDTSKPKQDWISARNHAQDAWKMWSELETAPHYNLSEQEVSRLFESLELLSRVWRACNRPKEAQYYERLRRDRISSVESSLSEPHMNVRVSSSTAGPHANSVLIRQFMDKKIDAVSCLRDAVEDSDEFTLICLLHPAEINISVDEKDEQGTALHFACATKNISMVEVLLREGADVDIADGAGKTALLKAIESESCDIVKALLEHNAGKINKRTRHDRNGTVLHFAVKNSQTISAELLLGADPGLIDQVDRCGQSALHYCAKSGSVEHAKKLIDHGAQLSLQDSVGRTPLYLALLRDKLDHEAIVRLLREAGADIGHKQLSHKQQNMYDRILDQRPGVHRAPTYSSWSNGSAAPREFRR